VTENSGEVLSRVLRGGSFKSAQGWNSFAAVGEGENGYPESGRRAS